MSGLLIVLTAGACAWIEPHQYLFLYRTRVATAPRWPVPSPDFWCPAPDVQAPSWLAQARYWQAAQTTNLLKRLDPSSRVPTPQPGALSLLAESVGSESLVKNRGRTAKIKKAKHHLFVQKPQQHLDGWGALECGVF